MLINLNISKILGASLNVTLANQFSQENYVWQHDQVIHLIESVGAHIDDYNHPKKRKGVFEHVANDLISLRYNVNAAMVYNKWNSLLRSYKKVKDNMKQTGRGASRVLFYTNMEEFLGSRPSNSSLYALNSANCSKSKDCI